MSNPVSTFYLRVHGHRLRDWGVHDGELLLVDRSIHPAPSHLVVVAHGGRFLLRPLEVEGNNWQLAPLGPEEAPLPLDPADLVESGVFGVGAAVVHDLVRGKRALPRRIR